MKTIHDDAAWQRLRKNHRRQHPICVVAGCGKPVAHVDHIVSVKVAPHRRLDPSNLQSLCHAHHNILTAAYDAGSVRGACDVDGMSLDPDHPWRQTSNLAAIAAVNAKPKADPLIAVGLKRQAVRGQP